MRNEYISDEGTQVSIDNPELGYSYMYSLGEGSGIKSKTDEDGISGELDMSNDDDLTGYTYADLFNKEELSGVSATVEDLDGKQVIHITSTQTDEENSKS